VVDRKRVEEGTRTSTAFKEACSGLASSIWPTKYPTARDHVCDTGACGACQVSHNGSLLIGESLPFILNEVISVVRFGFTSLLLAFCWSLYILSLCSSFSAFCGLI
jgi:hypothetical protein